MKLNEKFYLRNLELILLWGKIETNILIYTYECDMCLG